MGDEPGPGDRERRDLPKMLIANHSQISFFFKVALRNAVEAQPRRAARPQHADH